MRFIFALVMLFICESALANSLCKKEFKEEKYVESGFRAISIFDKMVYLPKNFVPKYQLIEDDGLKVSYYGYSVNEKGFILQEQSFTNAAFIENSSIAISNFNDLTSKSNKKLEVECGDINIRSYYDGESLIEYTLIYTDVLALTYISSTKGEWKKVLKNYLTH